MATVSVSQTLQSTYLSHVIAAIRKQTKMLSQRVAG